jgi:hypothetical protein
MTALAYAIAFFWLLVGCRRPADERWGYFAYALAMASAHWRPSDLATVICLAATLASSYALYLALRVRELRVRGAA